MTILVDSDILIEVSRGRDRAIVARWLDLGLSEDLVLCTPVSVAELWAGVRPSEHEALAELFRTLICVPLDAEAGRQAGEYVRQYRKSHGMELGDALIAAAAVRNRAALWTRNRKHYPMKDVVFY
ncbi:MAG: type II toxin-antitoxin system VapC family toxin [Candidatus Solibacter usitatus]|nr:type II toxin-antitoxin system VapC family toxin [Candidatus Solibacter usitatus]